MWPGRPKETHGEGWGEWSPGPGTRSLSKVDSPLAEQRPEATRSDHLGTWEKREGCAAILLGDRARGFGLPGGRFSEGMEIQWALHPVKPLIKTPLGPLVSQVCLMPGGGLRSSLPQVPGHTAHWRRMRVSSGVWRAGRRGPSPASPFLEIRGVTTEASGASSGASP